MLDKNADLVRDHVGQVIHVGAYFVYAKVYSSSASMALGRVTRIVLTNNASSIRAVTIQDTHWKWQAPRYSDNLSTLRQTHKMFVVSPGQLPHGYKYLLDTLYENRVKIKELRKKR